MFWKKSKLLIIYSTVDGHTKNICEYINKKLKNKKIISISSLEDAVKLNLEQFLKRKETNISLFGKCNKNNEI